MRSGPRRSPLRFLAAAGGLGALALAGTGSAAHPKAPTGATAPTDSPAPADSPARIGATTGEAPFERVLVLGFDGADPDAVGAMIADGELPHLAQLAEEGAFLPLETTRPSESPVAWATFATGMNPGKTRIFDFLEQRDDGYGPRIALVRESVRPLPGPAARAAAVLLLALAVFGAASWVAARLTRRRFRDGGPGVGPGPARIVGAVFGGLTAAGGWILAGFLPSSLPQAVRARQGDAFWQIAGAAGVETVALSAPMEFPVEESPGTRILAGFGVPDARRSFGLWAVYTTDLLEEESTETGGTRYPLRFRDGEAASVIRGPRDFTVEGPVAAQPEVEIPLRFRRRGERIEIEADGQRVTLGAGEWSDFVPLRFRLNPLVAVSGTVRFRVLSLEPNVSVYMEPVNFDPLRLPPIVDLSWPRGYAGELAERTGRFETVGWKIITNPLRDGAVSFDAFLEDVDFAREGGERLLRDALAEDSWRLLVSVFLFPDRLQHMLYRFADPDHPNHDPVLAARYGGGIAEGYRQMDRIVGEARAAAPPGTAVLVVSDHGFHPFRKQFSVNTWLAENGYLQAAESVGERRLEDLFDPEALFFPGVEWSRSTAFALGLSGIYLNQRGREPEGIVEPGAERERLLDRLESDLLAYRDPETGEPVVRAVHRREEIYEGPFVAEAPDLVLGLEPGYRIGWQSTLGGITAEVILPNLDDWSGDHCSMEDTAGVLLTNLRLGRGPGGGNPALRDIAPTVLELLGVAPPAEMDGVSLRPS